METLEKVYFKFIFNSDGTPHQEFPTIYVGFIPESMEMVYKVFLFDSSIRRGKTIDYVKTVIGNTVVIDKWNVDRDAALRGYEIFGIHALVRSVRGV